MAVPNTNFDAVLSTTLANYRKKFADNISNNIPFMKYMTMKGRAIESGGAKIVEELMYGENSTVASYNGTDTIDTTNQEGLSAAEFEWKQVAGTVTLTGTDELKNSGPEQLQSLMEAKTKQTEITMRNRIGEMLFGDGTGNSGKDVLGLEAVCDQDPTTGILGNIDRASYSFWRNKVDTTVGAYATNLFTKTSSMIRQLTRGSERPKLIVTGSTIFGYYEDLAFGKAQYLNPELANLGFAALKFQGIDLIFDSQCPSDRVYILNTDYLTLRIHKDRNFAMGKFAEPINGDYKSAKVKFAGQLTVSNCALQGVLSGVTA